ncbi:MAG: hypothetical protein GX889_06950 [Clostridiales bacterium]|nr:hypothetical protein [Clostridiales bacterium]
MILRNKKGKELIIANDEEFIYKGRSRKRIIKKSDARSMFYDDKVLGILTYAGKIYSFSLRSLLKSERSKLEELRLELNKENLLFNYTKADINYALYYPLPYLLGSIMIWDGFKDLLFLFILIVNLIVIIYNKLSYKKVLFNIDRDEFEIISATNPEKFKRHEAGKIKMKKIYEGIYKIEIKKDRKKLYLLFKDNPYLIKIYNTSLVKLFSKEK